MGKRKRQHLGTVEADPKDLTKNRGHEYGSGRSTEVQKDKRTKRKRTRRAQDKEAMKGW